MTVLRCHCAKCSGRWLAKLDAVGRIVELNGAVFYNIESARLDMPLRNRQRTRNIPDGIAWVGCVRSHNIQWFGGGEGDWHRFEVIIEG